jgi:hypothetical protein
LQSGSRKKRNGGRETRSLNQRSHYRRWHPKVQTESTD